MSFRLLAPALLSVCIATSMVSGCSWSEEAGSDEILFVRETTEGEAVYLMSNDGRDVRRLVEGTTPRWSPDGSRFAYVVDDYEKTKYCGTSVWVMNPETGGRRRVANTDGLVCSLAWAPDGVRLAYSTTSEVIVLNTETGVTGAVSLDFGLDGPMDWSRDGRELVVSTQVSSKLLDTWTGAERDIVRAQYTGDGRWSPDGERIAFARWHRSLTRRFIVIAKRDGRGRERITRGALDSGPAWSPDGKKIYFSRLPSTRFDDDTLAASEIWAIDLSTRSIRRLTRNNFVDRLPDARPEDRSMPAVPEPVAGDVVVPDLVGRHVLLEDEMRRFRGLGLTLQALNFLGDDGLLAVIYEQVPEGGARALRGSVVKVTGSELSFPYLQGVFSASVWKAHPGCEDAETPREDMYGDVVRRVLRRGMAKSRVVSVLGDPDRSGYRWSDWALGRLTYGNAKPIPDCIYLRVEFDRQGYATRFHQQPAYS